MEALSKFKYKVEGKFDSTPPPSESGEGVDTGAPPMATNIPAPPPLPPVMDPDGSLIPPPPPVPFGKWVWLTECTGCTFHFFIVTSSPQSCICPTPQEVYPLPHWLVGAGLECPSRSQWYPTSLCPCSTGSQWGIRDKPSSRSGENLRVMCLSTT